MEPKDIVRRSGRFWLLDGGDPLLRCDTMVRLALDVLDDCGAPSGGAWTLPARVAWLASRTTEERAIIANIVTTEELRRTQAHLDRKMVTEKPTE